MKLRLALFLLPLLCLPMPTASCSASSAKEKDELTQEALEATTEKIKAEVAALRERAFKRPVAVSVTDKAGLIDYLQKRMAMSTTPSELAAEVDLVKLIGVLPIELDYLAKLTEILEEQVGGFYDPEDERFFLMERFTGGAAGVILAHELTHALDDQLFDIDGNLEKLKDNADAQFAFQAVVEGSGTAVMNRWMGDHAGEFSLSELMDGGSADSEAMESAPPYLWKPLLAVYMRGAAFLARTESVMKGQMAPLAPKDIDHAFTEIPLSSEQILHPAKYWNEDERDDPIPVHFHGAGLPADWEVLRENTFGEFGLTLMVQPPEQRKGMTALTAITAKYTDEATEGWGGDRYVLLGKGEMRAVILQTVWDSEQDAVEFEGALGGVRAMIAEAAAGLAGMRGGGGAGVRVSRDGTQVRFVVWSGMDAGTAEDIAARVEFRVDG